MHTEGTIKKVNNYIQKTHKKDLAFCAFFVYNGMQVDIMSNYAQKQEVRK